MERLIDRDELRKILSVSRNTLSKLIESGMVPRPIVLGPRLNRWRASDIERVIQNGMASTKPGDAAAESS